MSLTKHLKSRSNRAWDVTSRYECVFFLSMPKNSEDCLTLFFILERFPLLSSLYIHFHIKIMFSFPFGCNLPLLLPLRERCERWKECVNMWERGISDYILIGIKINFHSVILLKIELIHRRRLFKIISRITNDIADEFEILSLVHLGVVGAATCVLDLFFRREMTHFPLSNFDFER